MARTPRKWQGARNPSGLKRVRQAERRHAILAPRRTAAKTLVTKAVRVATVPTEGVDPVVALNEALSALDRAAKVGAIHPNAAARRKSRLTIKVNAVLGGSHVTGAHVAKTTGKAAAQKAAKARIAAGKATKAKGAQTAAGKARAALSRSSRTDAGSTTAVAEPTTTETPKPAKPAKPAAKATTAKPATAKATTAKATTTKATTTKAKATATKPKSTKKAE